MTNEADRSGELIDNFLTGNLTEEEEKEFQKKLEDPSFQKQVEFWEDFSKAINYKKESELKSTLRKEEKKLKKNSFSLISSMEKRWMIWAFIIIVAGLAAWFFIFNKTEEQKNDPEFIYAAYFEPYKNTLFQIEKGLTEESIIREAFRFYDEKEFQKALENLERLPADNMTDDIAFYKANILLKLDKVDEAISILQNIIRNDNTQYKVQSKWYLAIANIKKENFREAKTLLEEIKDDPFFGKRADDLLTKVAKF